MRLELNKERLMVILTLLAISLLFEPAEIKSNPKLVDSISLPSINAPYESVSDSAQIRISPSGNWAAVWLESFLFIWDVENGELKLRTRYNNRIVSAQFSEDERSFAITEGKSLDLFILRATGEWTRELTKKWPEQDGSTICYSFGPDSTIFIAISSARQKLIQYDYENDEVIDVISKWAMGNNDRIVSVSCSQRIGVLAIARIDRVDLYQLADLTLIHSVDVILGKVDALEAENKILVGLRHDPLGPFHGMLELDVGQEEVVQTHVEFSELYERYAPVSSSIIVVELIDGELAVAQGAGSIELRGLHGSLEFASQTKFFAKVDNNLVVLDIVDRAANDRK